MPSAPAIQRINRGRGHSYKIDGLKVDGVTTLISKGLPKPALPYWSARTVAEYVTDAEPASLESLRSLGRDGMVKALKEVPWTARDTAAVRGTAVHTLAEKLIDGERVDVPDELAGHVEACVGFMDQWKPRAVLTEAVVGSRRWGYAGTLDLIADLPDGSRALLDYKTGASGIWPETALQLSAYRWADFFAGIDDTEVPMSEVGIDCSYAVWLRADGYDVIPVDTTAAVFKVFCHVAYVARQTERMSDWIGEACPPPVPQARRPTEQAVTP
jgi:hypothetical protein